MRDINSHIKNIFNYFITKIKKLYQKKYISYKIVFQYTFISIVWIIFSDKILFFIAHDKESLSTLNIYNGLFFVILTSIFLYKIIDKNISTLKMSHHKTKVSEERYRLLVENSPDIIFISRRGKFIYANSSALKFFDMEDLNNMLGTPTLDFFQKDYYKIINYSIEELQKNNNAIPLIERKINRKNGSSAYLEITTIPLLYEGESSLLYIGKDITERKQSEELQKRLEIEESLLNEVIAYNEIQTQFFSNLSHELKTPLNIIFSSIQLLEINYNDLDDKFNKYMNMMHQNCYRLLRLINNLIDITKIDSGFYKIDMQNLNIVNIIEDISLSVAEYIKNKDIHFLFDTEIEEKIIACDPDKIERIMLNLLSNAVKFTESGGSITVNIYDKGKTILISVKDTGKGISEDDQKIIFNRFMQVDKSLRRNQEGSGIGLALVKSLVELHDGTIEVRSEYGKGSEFIIELPVTTVNAEMNNPKQIMNIKEDSFIERINIEFSDIYSN